VTISSGLCRLFAISDPPFPNYNGGPTLWGKTSINWGRHRVPSDCNAILKSEKGCG
jgi:hypothetical protein